MDVGGVEAIREYIVAIKGLDPYGVPPYLTMEYVAGKTLDELARREVFEPLGMVHSRFVVEEGAPGLVLAAGTVIGSQIGVKLTVQKGHAWVKGFVTVMVVVFAVKLWFGWWLNLGSFADGGQKIAHIHQVAANRTR